MKKVVAIAGLLALAGCNNGADKAAARKDATLDSEMARFSYAIGLDVGRSLARIDEKLDLAAFNKGVATTLNGDKPELDAEQIAEVKKAVLERQQKKMLVKRKQLADDNKREGAAFLAKNKTAKGVKTTKSGLQYMVLKAGDGARPKPSDVVKVNYEGRLLDGKVFDSSYRRGQPVTFPLSSVIKGWKEGLQLMNVGGKYRLFIPSDLAYGENGAGNVIGPNAVLTFDVELLGIEKKGGAGK